MVCVQVVGHILVKTRGWGDDGSIGSLQGGMGWSGGDILAIDMYAVRYLYVRREGWVGGKVI